MAEVTKARTGEHLRKLFAILSNHPEGLKASVALEKLAEQVTLTDYERGVYESSGTRRFEKIIRFATVDCVKAGWLVKTKGVWTVTEEGKSAYESFRNPEMFYGNAVRLYWKWKNAQAASAKSQAGGAVEAAEIVDEAHASGVTFEQAEEQAWAEIEAYLRVMPPYEIQDLVSDLLRAMGYHVAWVAPPGKDGGVDILATTDPLAVNLPRIKVQVKRSQPRIDLQTLNSFLAVIDSDSVGIFVATGGFTKDAENAARSQVGRRVTLIDVEKLVDLWVEHYGKLDDKARKRLPLTPIYFLTPSS